MKVFILTTLCFLSNAIIAAIPIDGWYGGLNLGASHAFHFNFNITNPLTRRLEPGQVNYKTGMLGGGEIGYRYDKLRSELEVLYNKNSFKEVQLGEFAINDKQNRFGLSTSGSTYFTALMFNTFYELYKEDSEVRFVPYGGLVLV